MSKPTTSLISKTTTNSGNTVRSRPTRRQLLQGAFALSSISATSLLPSLASAASTDSKPIKVASLFDVTGNLNLYGIPMMNVSKYAVDTINASGGVLGRQLELITHDTQSKIELYSRYAQQIAADPDIAAVVGCITGASREAARPILSRAGKLLFFPSVDEGGECDKYTFMQGTDCLQQETPLVDWAVKNAGKSFYVVAADYVYGHVATAWTKTLVAKAGGTISAVEFIPLEITDFSATIRKIQSSQPAVIMSNLVGNNHLSFYRQFAAAGLKKHIPIVSPTFGLGNEQLTLTPAEAEGIIVAYSYFASLPGSANEQFLSGYQKLHPNAQPVTDISAQVWNAWHQWKLGVEKAKSTKTDAVVVALESGIAYTGPSGKIVVDPHSHRNIQDVHLAQVDSTQKYKILQTYPQIHPATEVVGAGSCDLIGKNKDSHIMIHPKF